MDIDELRSALIEHDVLANPRKLQKRFLDPAGLWTPLIHCTAWMKQSTAGNVSKRVNWVLAAFPPNPPICAVCQKQPCSWNGLMFSTWCSVACKNRDNTTRVLVGLKNKLNAKSRCEKMVATRIARFGVNGSLLGTDITNKRMRALTIQRRYGSLQQLGAERYKSVSQENGGVHPVNAKKTKTSKYEIQIANQLRQMGFQQELILNDRSVLNGKEMDIWIPSRNIGIEYNGERFHSDVIPAFAKDPRRMYKKYKLAESIGVQIINVFGAEWKQRPQQVLNFIMAKLTFGSHVLNARSCTVTNIDKTTARDFVNQHHIQQLNKNPAWAVGLYNNDALVCVMTFNKHHRDAAKGVVLSRYCCAAGMRVRGGASKLLHQFVASQQVSAITSWSDNRWSSGALYLQLGFKLVTNGKPDYFYVDIHGNHYSKQKFNKSYLKKMGAIGHTEQDMAKSLGLFRVFDCGKKTWVWTAATI